MSTATPRSATRICRRPACRGCCRPSTPPRSAPRSTREKATPSAALGPGIPPHEAAETTHYSVVDGDGNAVAVTYTLNGNFGAAVVAPGTGFLLNNEMDDFTVKPGAAESVRPGAGRGQRDRPGQAAAVVDDARRSSRRDGRPVLVLGSPGGPRIITAVLETLTNIVDFGLTPQDAVAAPRFHHQCLPDTLYYERGGFPPETLAALAERGLSLERAGAVGRGRADRDRARWRSGRLLGVNDPRRPAGAAARVD